MNHTTRHIIIEPAGVCCTRIEVDLADNKFDMIKFYGGCNGSLTAVAKLLEGVTVKQAESILGNINCNNKGTSCCVELIKGVKKALEETEGDIQ